MMPRDDDGRLAAVIRALGSALDLEQLLRSAARLLADAAAAEDCLVYLADGDGRLRLRAASDGHLDRIEPEALEAAAELAEQALQGRSAIVPAGPARSSALPLLARSGRAIGAVCLRSASPAELSADDRAFLLASRVADRRRRSRTPRPTTSCAAA